jgi:hypothetical protein
MTDLIALGILALAGSHGWRRGTLLMLLGILSIFAGYVCAAFLFRPVGRFLAGISGMSPMLALPIAGLFVLLAISTAIRIATWRIERRRAQARTQGEPPSRIDSAGGAFIGIARAAVFVVLGAWLVQTAHNVSHLGPDISRSVSGRLASGLMRRATYAIMQRTTHDPMLASMMSVLASRPDEGVRAMNVVMRDERVRQLWNDQRLRGMLASGDAHGLAANPGIRALSGDTAFLNAADALGIMPAGAAGSALPDSLASRLGPLTRRMESIRSDSEIARMIADPAMKRMMDRGDFAALAGDRRFNDLAGRVLQKLRVGP